MTSARQNILARLQAVKTGMLKQLSPKPATKQIDSALEVFSRCLEQNHAEVLHVDQRNLPATLEQLLQKKTIQSLITTEEFAYLTSVKQLEVVSATKAKVLNKDDLFYQVDAGLTLAKFGIAETGSLVLWLDQHQPRSISLVPPIHICVLYADNLYPTFAEFISSMNIYCSGALPTNVVLVSGPSKTADIQQTLAYGAHGPKQLIVLIVNRESDLTTAFGS